MNKIQEIISKSYLLNEFYETRNEMDKGLIEYLAELIAIDFNEWLHLQGYKNFASWDDATRRNAFKQYKNKITYDNK